MVGTVSHDSNWRWQILALAVGLAVGSATLEAGQPGPQPPDLSKMTVLRDIEYVPGGHERQKLDLYLPKEADPSGKRPLLVWIHGGAWLGGNKDRPPALRFVALLRQHGLPVRVLRTDQPGMILYEDDVQVVAESRCYGYREDWSCEAAVGRVLRTASSGDSKHRSVQGQASRIESSPSSEAQHGRTRVGTGRNNDESCGRSRAGQTFWGNGCRGGCG